MTIKKGDLVKVISGSSKIKGKISTVIKVYPKLNKLLLDNVNLKKVHVKRKHADEDSKKSGILEKVFPIHSSKVMLYDKETCKTFRIGYKKKNFDKNF